MSYMMMTRFLPHFCAQAVVVRAVGPLGQMFPNLPRLDLFLRVENTKTESPQKQVGETG